MFKRISRKRQRREEDEALGLDDEMKEALGFGGVDSDSDESESESGSDSSEGEEGEQEEDNDDSDSNMNDEEEEEEEGEEKPPTMSKRALKKLARQEHIKSIRERYEKRKRAAAERKEALKISAELSAPTSESSLLSASSITISTSNPKPPQNNLESKSLQPTSKKAHSKISSKDTALKDVAPERKLGSKRKDRNEEKESTQGKGGGMKQKQTVSRGEKDKGSNDKSRKEKTSKTQKSGLASQADLEVIGTSMFPKKKKRKT